MEIRFAFRRSSVAAHMGTIQCRITVNRVRVVLESVSRHQVHTDHFDRKKQRVSARSKHAEDINLAINQCEVKLMTLFRQYDSFQRPLTARGLARIYHGDDRVRPTIPQLVTDFLAEKKALRAAPGTVQTYGFKFRPLLAFLIKEGKSDLFADEFNPQILERYRVWLIGTRGNSERVADKTRQAVKTLMLWAHGSGRITKNPLDSVRIHVDKTPKLIYLTREEVELLETTELTPGLRRVADCYLFSCFTGIAYQDMLNLTAESVQFVENRRCLVGKRQKTGTEFIVPITLAVAKLMITYGGPEMPLPENRKYNTLLKQVMLAVGITKSISGHSARKTFADWCLNDLNMSREATIVAMGQKNPRELEPYAKLRPKRLMSEFPDNV